MRAGKSGVNVLTHTHTNKTEGKGNHHKRKGAKKNGKEEPGKGSFCLVFSASAIGILNFWLPKF